MLHPIGKKNNRLIDRERGIRAENKVEINITKYVCMQYVCVNIK